METNCTTISPTPSLFVAQTPSTCSRGTWGNFGETRSGVGKMALWSTKAAISLKRVKREKKLLWGAYRNSPSLFRTVPSPTSYGLPFPKIGGSHPTQNSNRRSLLSRERIKLRTSNLARTITVSIGIIAHEKVWRKGSVGVSRDYPIFFGYPLLSQEREKLLISNLC